MSNTTQTQTTSALVTDAPAGVAARIAVAEVIARTFTYGGWAPKLRWSVQPSIGTKLYVVDGVADQGEGTKAPQALAVAKVIGFSVAFGEQVPKLHWFIEPPKVGAMLYQDVVSDSVAPITSGADYKGHENLAEMLVTHLDNYRRALKFQRGHAKDADDRAWYDHELSALLDIEAACRADIKAAREAKANAVQ
ncbi:hypothetical protein [Pseudomonas sp. EMN2]|uniref:hypothetical protein n=1 Tax=Pseudomonas sp. EMN2 TaxID=2615212 RepID=UPI00129C0EE6|nr:hypothetical protein [Pseudomonas sp. EMN2]